jgi:glycosyltransferase involved in cell wall biosynthesis
LAAVEYGSAVHKLRRGIRRVKSSMLVRGPTRRSLARTPPLGVDVAVDQDASARYAQMLRSRRYQLPEADLRIAIVVEHLTLEDERTFELVGLAIGLARVGVDTVILGANATSPPPGTDVLVCPADVSTTFDPAGEVDLPLMIAWVHGFPTGWVRRRGLDWFDVVLCGSSGLKDALASQFAGPIEVLPHVVDTELFTPPDDGDPREGFVSTVEQRIDHRPLVEAIGSTPFEIATAILDSPRTYPRVLRRFVRGVVGPLGRPSVLRGVTVAFSASPSGEFDRGVLERSALEALSCGAAVVSRSDLRDAGLMSPRRVPDGHLGPLVDEPADRSDIERDREHIRLLHSLEAGAARLMEVVAEARRYAGTWTVLGYHPNYWNQPYVANLYRGLRSRGVRAIPTAEPRMLLDDPGLRRPSVFHLQWTAPILAGAVDAGDARDRADAFLAQLDRLRAAGTPIIWTVHNVLPHECRYPDIEIRLRVGLAERSDVVHVLNEVTLDDTAGLYRLPADRVRVIPEFKDPVTPVVSRAEARARLSLADDDVVYLVFGRIRPYKQLDRLLDAFAQHRRSHPRARLLVAGHLARSPGWTRLAGRCRRERGVVARFGHVPDDEVEVLFAASDATIVSYPALNSGVAVTAVAHGCPVAALGTGALPEVIGRDGGLVFGPDEDLVEVLGRLYVLVTETDVRARVTKLGQTRSSATMATEFARVVDELVSR